MSISRRLAKYLVRYDDPKSMASRMRAKRAHHLITLIENAHKNHGKVEIIDVGGTHNYWTVIPREVIERCKVHITLLNLPGSRPPPKDGNFSFEQGDICEGLGFKNNAFHIAHSNSVIEHVGTWPRMQSFAAEVTRLAPNYLVQTPNFWFPIEPHCMTPFFHWLPEPLKVKLVMQFELGHWPKQSTVSDATHWVQGAHLLDKNMMSSLFPDAVMHVEHWMGLEKSLLAICQENMNIL